MLVETRQGESFLTLSSDSRWTHESIKLRHIDAPWYVIPDLLGRWFQPYEFLSAPMDLMNIIGYPQGSSGSDSSYIGYPPYSMTHGRLESINAWDTYLSNVKHLFSDWNFSNGLLPGNQDENPVSHFNLVGRVNSLPTPDDFYRKSNGVGGYLNYQIDGWPLYDLALHGSAQAPYIVQHQSYNNWFYPVGLLLEEALLQKPIVNGAGWDTTFDGIIYHYDSFEVEYQGLSVKRISYRVSLRGISPWYWRQRVQRVKCEYSFIPTSVVMEMDSSRSLSSVVTALCRRSVCTTGYNEMFDPEQLPVFNENYAVPSLTSDYNNYYDPVVLDLVKDTYFTHPGHNRSRVCELIGANDDKSYYMTGYRSFLDFKRDALHVLPECFPSVFFSTKNAVDGYFERMKANHIEALAELGDILKVADVFKLAFSLRKSPNLSTMLKLLKLLADAKLTYSLGIAPTISDAMDIAKRLPSFIERFSSITGEETLYGTFFYDFPDKWFPSFGRVRLKSHSKIRISVLPDSYLSAILPIRSLGLLPTLSAMWDLVPFSFVVDWFLKLGDNQDDVETAAMLLAMQCYTSVHSISIIYNFDSDDAQMYDFNVDVSAPKLAGYQYYDRFVLGGLPSLGPSKLPFHGIAQIPDWGTAAALIYQFIGK